MIMRINPRIITDKQLEKLLQRFTYTEWPNNPKLKKNYLIFLFELRRRRSSHKPGILKKDPQDKFGEINRAYYNTLSPSEVETYLYFKWPEL